VEKAMIAMSGGVDSSVVAYIMRSAGYDCVGAMLKLCGEALPNADGCGTLSHAADARSVADRLGIPFTCIDATAQFRRDVIDPFVHSYESGQTPNPCVACNKHMKFGLLLQEALAAGCDVLATGHYAQITQNPETGRYLLHKAVDKNKDQTYFLAGLTQEQLSHLQFPLGAFSKEQVRQIAQEQGFLTAGKRDSQDICFVPSGDYVSFMRAYTGNTYPAGDYLDLQGNVVGRHNGAVSYTIGQRKGLHLAMGQPVYVCSKDMQKNTVTVGPESALYAKSLRANNWNWLPFPTLTEPLSVTAKVRYRHTEQPATVYPEENGFARVEFDIPQRAITAGQAVVLYQGDFVVGSGTIVE